MKRECYTLGGAEGQTEETSGVRGRHAAKIERILAAGGGDLRERASDPCRLVPFPPERNRCQIGRVGLHQQPLPGHESKQVVVRPLVEGHDPAERYVPAGIERGLRQGMGAGVTMQDTDDARGTRLGHE